MCCFRCFVVASKVRSFVLNYRQHWVVPWVVGVIEFCVVMGQVGRKQGAYRFYGHGIPGQADPGYALAGWRIRSSNARRCEVES